MGLSILGEIRASRFVRGNAREKVNNFIWEQRKSGGQGKGGGEGEWLESGGVILFLNRWK